MPVTQTQVQHRETYAEGRTFGEYGKFEKLECKLFYAINPNAEEYKHIIDLDNAPVNDLGLVEFSGDLTIIKPVDCPPKCLLIDIPNRGRRVSFSMFNRPSPDEILSDPCAPGDGFLCSHGFAVASIGWQFDAEGMSLSIPQANVNGGSVSGKAVCRMQPGRSTSSLYIGQAGGVTYEADGPAALFVQDHTQEPYAPMPTDSWRFGRLKNGAFAETNEFICSEEPFLPGKFYTLVYETSGAPIVGLGLVAIREAVKYLKTNEFEWNHRPPEHAVGFGASQTGRVLRHYLYVGLNDDHEKPILDGLLPHIAGAQRGDFNHRFAQPSSMGVPAAGQLFPFAGRTATEPHTKRQASLYENCRNLPKVLITNTSWEYWRGDAALAHITPDGSSDLAHLPNERMYLFAGTHHINGVLPLSSRFALTNEQVSYPMNCISYTPLIRAALINLRDWVVDNVEPPDSRIPQIANGTLVQRDDVLRDFAKSPSFPRLLNADELPRINRYDLGELVNQGICDFPAKLLEPYAAMVASVNEKLNEESGIRLPEIQLGIGIHSGWNPRHPDHGAATQPATFAGFSVFDDSVEEFADQQRTQSEIELIADELVAQRYVLPHDRNIVVQNALVRLAAGIDAVRAT